MKLRSLTSAISTEYLKFFISIGVVLILTPLLLKYLGGVQFGIWVTFSSLVGYFGVLDLGLQGAMPKLFADQLALEEKEKLNRLVSTLFFFLMGGSLLLIIAIVFLSLPLENFLNIPSEYLSLGKVVLLLLGGSFSVSFLANIWYSLLFADKKLHLSNGISIFSLAVLLGMTTLFLTLGYGLIGVAFANLLVNVFGFGIAFLLIKRFYPYLKIRWGLWDRKLFQSALEISIYILIGNFGVRLIYNTDNIVITKLIGIEEVAAYAIAFRLCFLSTNLVFSFIRIFLPEYSRLKAMKDKESLQGLFLRSSQIAVALGVLLAVLLLFFGEKIIDFWTGEAYFVGTPTFFVLSLLLLTTPAIQTGTTTLLGLGKNKIYTYMILVEALFNIILSVVLAGVWGVLGVALGTLLAQLLTNFWFVPLHTLKQLDLKSGGYWKLVFLPAWFSAFPAIVLAYFCHRLAPPQNIWILGGEGILVIGCYILGYWGWDKKFRRAANAM